MIRVGVCDGKTTREDVSPTEISKLLTGDGAMPRNGERPKRVLWVDVNEPTDEDWKTLAREFKFHPLAIEDAQHQDQRAKVDAYDGYLFLSVRAWIDAGPRADQVVDVTCEIDIFLGTNYLVTVHDGRCGAVRQTKERWVQNPDQMPAEAHNSPAYLLYLLLDAVVDEYFPAMDALDEAIDEVEARIYGDQALPDVKPALRLKKQLLLMRQAITPMRDVLNALLRTDDAKLLPSPLRVYYQDVYDHALRLVEQVDLHRDLLSGAMDALMAQTSNRLNQVMKTMTALSTILMSVSLVAGVYGMNFRNMPELGLHYGYYYALTLMAAIAVGLALYFRKIKWF
jgi:magnesium transporter